MSFLLIPVAVALAACQADGTHWADLTLRVKAYEVNATLAAPGDRLQAVTHVTFDPLQLIPSELVFYLHSDLAVDSVFLGSEKLRTTSARVPYDLDNFGMATRTAADVTEDMILDNGLTVFYSGHGIPSPLWFPVFQEDVRASYPVDFVNVTIRKGNHVSEWCADDVDFKTVRLTGRVAHRTPQ
jgi:hypothetical protein